MVRGTETVVGFNGGILLGRSIESFLSELASSVKKSKVIIESIRIDSATLVRLMNIVSTPT